MFEALMIKIVQCFAFFGHQTERDVNIFWTSDVECNVILFRHQPERDEEGLAPDPGLCCAVREEGVFHRQNQGA